MIDFNLKIIGAEDYHQVKKHFGSLDLLLEYFQTQVVRGVVASIQLERKRDRIPGAEWVYRISGIRTNGDPYIFAEWLFTESYAQFMRERKLTRILHG